MTAGAADTVDAMRERYLERLAASDEQGAVRVALDALDAGTDTEVVLLDVVAAAQRAVGERWAAGQWTVVQEHVATHISERVVAAVARHAPTPAPTGVGAIAVACLDGEWHGLPARLLAEVLARHGWDVRFLGASVPADQIAVHVHSEGPDVVAISSSLPSRLPAARRMVEVCRATGTPVLAGGPAFGEDGRWARAVGADGWAPDARAAAAMLDRDPSGRWFEAAETGVAETGVAEIDVAEIDVAETDVAGTARAVGHEPAGPGSGPVDEAAREEQGVLHARRGELVAAVAGRLRPGTVGAVPEALADDLGHLVDFLAASVFVDDPTLLHEFVRWVGTVTIPQGLGRGEAVAALEHLAVLLDESPRTRSFLRDVRAGVAGPTPSAVGAGERA